MVPSRRRTCSTRLHLMTECSMNRSSSILAAVEVAGAFDGHALAHAHGMFVAAGHEYARFNAAVRADPQVALEDIAAEHFDLVVENEGLIWIRAQFDADADLYALS